MTQSLIFISLPGWRRRIGCLVFAGCFCKWALLSLADLRKETCKIRHSISLGHPVAYLHFLSGSDFNGVARISCSEVPSSLCANVAPFCANIGPLRQNIRGFVREYRALLHTSSRAHVTFDSLSSLLSYMCASGGGCDIDA